MNELMEKLRDISKKPIFLKAAMAVGVLAIVLILISDLSGGKDKKSEMSEENVPVAFGYSDVYADSMDTKLCEILTSIEGVGKAQVMLTVSSTEEYVYAETVKRGTSQAENSYVIIDKGSQKEALVKKVNNPTIKGVVIVCEGGDDPRVCEKIYKAVSTALDISTSKIYVAEMK